MAKKATKKTAQKDSQASNYGEMDFTPALNSVESNSPRNKNPGPTSVAANAPPQPPARPKSTQTPQKTPQDLQLHQGYEG
jgi:hypothetical protein